MKFLKVKMWFYVHSYVVALFTAFIGVVTVALSSWVSAVVESDLLADGLTVMLLGIAFIALLLILLFSLVPHRSEVLDKISHFDDGTLYEDVAIDDHRILLIKDGTVDELCPKQLYRYDVLFNTIDSTKHKKSVVFHKRLLNEGATPLETKFFNRLRDEVMVSDEGSFSKCKYGKITELKVLDV